MFHPGPVRARAAGREGRVAPGSSRRPRRFGAGRACAPWPRPPGRTLQRPVPAPGRACAPWPRPLGGPIVADVRHAARVADQERHDEVGFAGSGPPRRTGRRRRATNGPRAGPTRRSDAGTRRGHQSRRPGGRRSGRRAGSGRGAAEPALGRQRGRQPRYGAADPEGDGLAAGSGGSTTLSSDSAIFVGSLAPWLVRTAIVTPSAGR